MRNSYCHSPNEEGWVQRMLTRAEVTHSPSPAGSSQDATDKTGEAEADKIEEKKDWKEGNNRKRKWGPEASERIERMGWPEGSDDTGNAAPETPNLRAADTSNAEEPELVHDKHLYTNEGDVHFKNTWQELLQSTSRSAEGATHMAKLASEARGAATSVMHFVMLSLRFAATGHIIV